MKTTIDVPDELLTRAKIYAAQHKTTLKDLVLEGLLQVTAQSPAAVRDLRQRNAERLIESLQAHNTKRMQPLSRDEIYNRRTTRPR
jgi:hypothetical protein